MLIVEKRQVLNGYRRSENCLFIVKTEPPKAEQVCRIFTSCDNVSFLNMGDPYILRTSVTGMPHIVRLSLFYLDRKPSPYVGQVSQDYHFLRDCPFFV
jgi:hypothetical protein